MTTSTKKKWLLGIALFAALATLALVLGGLALAAHFEPFIREQTIRYLEKRFDSDVELAALHISLPHISPLKVAIRRGRGAIAHVEGEGVSLRHRKARNGPPLFVMKRFTFDVDLGSLFDATKTVHAVTLD